MSVSVELTFRWPMGHRILGLAGRGAKCRNIHGHNWVAVISLPNDDQMLEFGEVKHLIGTWIDKHWDHGFMLAGTDPFLAYLADNHMKFYTTSSPPTTEAIATELACQTAALVNVMPLAVEVVEGYRNAATWKNDNAWP